MRRHKGAEWDVPADALTWDQVTASLLMDLRDELKLLRRDISVLFAPELQRVHRRLDAATKRIRTLEKERKAG